MRGLLAGIGIGIGLGILFAPMSGRETRENIRERANDLADQARGAMEEGRERIGRGITAVKSGIDQAAERGTQAVNNMADRTGTQGV
jgi:gas vesicle protein